MSNRKFGSSEAALRCASKQYPEALQAAQEAHRCGMARRFGSSLYGFGLGKAGAAAWHRALRMGFHD